MTKVQKLQKDLDDSLLKLRTRREKIIDEIETLEKGSGRYNELMREYVEITETIQSEIAYYNDQMSEAPAEETEP